MYKFIFKIFALLVDVFLSFKLATFSLLLADKNSDASVLGAIGILLLLVLWHTIVVQTLFKDF